ncbi:MAG TPA: UDP-N-acetylmuramoyl-tripeptide--D-alanyl-D-alanine ligase [Candidatus Saccharimonadales bacterium]|nr:UDP-N-acetylmuramoyl-tripeptide--D-alanyl-D-alanine ligase [Candidatus Saccharimonadales bacterium]
MAECPLAPTPAVRRTQWLVAALIIVELAVGASIIAGSVISDGTAGIWPFGIALIVGYPVVSAHVLGLCAFVTSIIRCILRPRRAGKDLLCRLLEAQVVRLRHRHKFKVVAVVGSIGKTSTKMAIAHLLMQSKNVVYQEGNYNDRLTVPLVVFGRALPGLTNVPAWLRIIISNELKIRRQFNCDVAVLELGTDGPGQIKDFAYLQPDIAVVTALTPEHMEFFKTLDAVAAEELTVTDFSKKVLVNADDSPEKYLKSKKITTYGTGRRADYRVSNFKPDSLNGVQFKLKLGKKAESFESPMFGKAGAKISAAAVATAYSLGMKAPAIVAALKELPPVSGRMQLLPGKQGSTLIDDTYNASPAPVMAGLDVLASADTTQRIAILGSMNELGDYAEEAHEIVGKHCKPENVDLVVTIGRDAKAWLAPEAERNGCKVETFMSPYEAGEYVLKQLKDGAVALGEGSQNGVFAEEAIKQLLENPQDAKRLVRQSPYWLKIKAKQFGQS